MNCIWLEELVALYVERELGPPELGQVEAHLKRCPGCRAFADEMRASQAALKGLGDEEIDPAAFVRVRSAVMRRVGRPGGLPYWGWLATAAACILLVIVMYPRGSKPQPQAPPRPTRAAVVTPEPPKAAVAQTPPRPRAHATKARAAARTPKTVSEPVVIKIITDDPDVVIYWISD